MFFEMKWKFLLLLFAVLFITTAGIKTGVGGINTANLDTTVSPKTDFYQFACGGWMKSHPLTGEYSRLGTFDVLTENNNRRIRELITDLSAGTIDVKTMEGKVGLLYKMAMDSVKLNQEGYQPIVPYIEEVEAVKTHGEMIKLIAKMNRLGFDPYFSVFVGPDEKNSSMNLLQTYQGGLGLGDRDYYVKEDAHSKEILVQYRAHVVRMFSLVGYSGEDAQLAAEHVLALETRLAEVSYDRLQLRNPYANYHKMNKAELAQKIPTLDWDTYFCALGLTDVKEINLRQVEIVQEMATILAEEDLEIQKSYLIWKIIDATASYLSDDFVRANFDFYDKILSGKKELSPRWKRAVESVDGALGEVVGQLYVEKYFPVAAKQRMDTLVMNLKQAFAERISNLTWMSKETKAKALDKLISMRVKIGYPDKWTDYSSLCLKEDSYVANVLRIGEFNFNKMLDKIGKPVDKAEWLMNPQMVNAYYAPTMNEICFPAGILQPPYFDMNADDAVNYGAIGVVIGHEMTHGFDDQGRHYDKNGNLNDWWTSEDSEKFEQRAQVLVDWFNGIEVLPGLHANGELTLGENIADYGGLQIAFQAFRRVQEDKRLGVIDGFTPEQRFYLSYASLWAANIRDESIRLLTQMDVHSLGRWRVNATLPHIDGWYQAFGITVGDPMYLAPEGRAVIW